MKCAYMEDISHTLYAEFGVDYSVYEPALPGKALW